MLAPPSRARIPPSRTAGSLLEYTFRMVVFQRSVALLLVAFFCVGVLAYSASMTQMDMHHDMGGATQQICPMMGNTPACANALDHISHWRTSFTALLVEILAVFALAVLMFVRRDLFELYDTQYEKHRLREHVPIRPTLFQELFSQGILNPKVP